MRLRFVLLLLASAGLLWAVRPSSPTPRPQPPAPALQEAAPAPPQRVVREYRVRSGDTLYGILSGLGLSETSIRSVAVARPDGLSLARLVPGQPYRVILSQERAVEYQYEPDGARIVRVAFDGEVPRVSVEPIPLTVRTEVVAGAVDGSLFAAVDALGEGPSLAMALADIFAWQIDFFRDIRGGDTFRVLVEKVHRDGRFVRYGDVLAAEFVNAGRRHRAVLFRSPAGEAGYYDEGGGSLRKQFLKAALKFRRVSSGFTSRRLHPVTGRVAPHLGVDYAAPVGTPVMSIGDGRVVLKKTDAVNGRFVKIRHNGTYSTAYAHLNSFAAGLSVGSAVRQGQVIGYVGQSGRATGPHLHFVMYRDGRVVDPGKVDVPRASSVAAGDRAAFQALAVERLALLGAGQGTEEAANRALP